MAAGVLRWFLVLMLAAMALAPAQAQTTVGGPISVDTRWSAAQGPYLVQANVTVQGGATLSIDPGVTVYMAAGTSLRVQQGSVRALGRATQRIRVLSDQARTGGTPAPGDWFQWIFEAGTVNTLLEELDFEHGRGLAINGAAPVLNRVDIRRQQGPAITLDLAASPSGVGNSASDNELNGILVPAGDITGSVRWGLRGLPYVVATGTVSVGASPAVSSVTPATVEQGATLTLTVNGSRLSGLAAASFDRAGLALTPFSGGSATQLFVQLQVDAAAALGAASLRLQVDGGEIVVPNAVTVTPPLPAITTLVPSTVLAGAGLSTLTLTGRNFGASSLVLVNSAALPTTLVSSTELRATLPNQTALGTLQVQVQSPHPQAAAQPLLSNTVNLSVQAPVPPTVGVEPTPIALPPDNRPREVTLRLSKADYRDNTITLSVTDAGKASVSPASLVIPAGQTSARITLVPIVAGTTSLVLDSTTLARVSVPLFITADFRGANTAYAAPVGVVVTPVVAPVTQTLTLGPASVGVAVGGVMTQASPAALTLGASGTLTLSGVGIPAGAQVSLVPPTALTLGAVTASADGTRLELPIAVAADAALGSRRVVVKDAGGRDITFANPARAVVQVMPGLPTIQSIEPIFSTRGRIVRLLVRGRNLHQGQLSLQPDTGLRVDAAPSIATDGSTLSANVDIAADAPTGARVVQVLTPAGATDALASAANTFTVAASTGNALTPVASSLVGVVVGAAVPAPQPVSVQRSTSLVGVLLGAGAVEVAPRTAVIGTDVPVLVRGAGLQAVSAVGLVPATGVVIQEGPTVNAEGTELGFTLRVDPGAALGARRLVLTAGGKPLTFSRPTDGVFLISAPVPELDAVAPQVLVAGQAAVRVGVRGRFLTNVSNVRIEPSDGVTVSGPFETSPDGTSLSFTVSVAAGAASGERAVVVSTAAGDSTLTRTAGNLLRIASQVGPTYKDLQSPLVGVVVGSAVRPADPLAHSLAAPLVGVMVGTAPGGTSVNSTTASSTVGVLIGAAAQAMAPTGWLQGAAGNITVLGWGLDSVASVAVLPSTGLLVGSPVVSGDGTQLQVTLSVAPDAPLVPRRLRLLTAAGTDLPFLSGSAALFGIGSLPTLTSLSPIVMEQGKAANLVVRGSNLKGVTGASFEPGAGLRVAGALVWAQDALGESLTLPIQVDAGAATGARVLRLLVPGGATTTDPSPANSVTVIPPQ